MSKSESVGAAVAAQIRAAVLDGDFMPNQRLIEADLCEMFSASRTAIRSALVELANEGVIERIQNRGARVREISLVEAIEIAEVRMVVEGLCAYKAAQRATDAEVQELVEIGETMKGAVASGNLHEYSAANKRLHARIGEISCQSTAYQIIERVRAQIVRHQYRLAMQPGRPDDSLPEHLAIIEAIRRRRPEDAEQAVRRHLVSVIDAMTAVEMRRTRGRAA